MSRPGCFDPDVFQNSQIKKKKKRQNQFKPSNYDLRNGGTESPTANPTSRGSSVDWGTTTGSRRKCAVEMLTVLTLNLLSFQFCRRELPRAGKNMLHQCLVEL